jgi:GTP1/Obg family GTP-binding protein
MNHDFDQRLTRIEMGLDELRSDMAQHATQLRRNHSLLVEFIEIVSKAEEPTDGLQLERLLEQFVLRMDQLTDSSEKNTAVIDTIAKRLFEQEASIRNLPKLNKARTQDDYKL